MYVHVFTCLHASMCLCVHTHVCVATCVHLSLCVQVYVYDHEGRSQSPVHFKLVLEMVSLIGISQAGLESRLQIKTRSNIQAAD